MDPLAKLQQLRQELQDSRYGATLHFNPISISLCLFIFFLFLLKLFSQKKLKLPPSPPKLPIIGNLHQLGSLPHRSLGALSQKYGPLMFLKLGQTPALVVSSAKMAREIMKTHEVKFSNRQQTTAANLLTYGCQDLVFSQYGEDWRKTKRICNVELLSVKRVESFQCVRDEEVGLLVDRIRKACGDESCVNLSQLLDSTTNNIVSRCVLGDKFEDDDGNSGFADVIRRAMVLLSAVCVADFFPGFRWIDELRGIIGELKRTSRTLDVFLDKLIEEHREKTETDSHSDKKDFVDIILKLQRDDKLDYQFTKAILKGILLDMFVGGSDTTATGLEWTMAELMRNPSSMKKAQEEVRRIVGNKSKIELKHIDKMEYMNCVIKESLRLHPPIPLIPRETTEGSVELEGFYIPSKTRVFVNIWAIQRDPMIWDTPNEFIPERFIDNSMDFQGQKYELIPFGRGRRMCPGILFGLLSFKYSLANILYWFDWTIPDGTVMDKEEENGLTGRKKVPLHLKPTSYSNLSTPFCNTTILL